MTSARTVEDYIAGYKAWSGELEQLRGILQSTGLEEGVKWGAPCYMRDGKNIVGIGAFKSYFGLWFFQGALLEDKSKKLINAQEGKTRAMRQWRMHSAADIKPRLIRSYVAESIRHAKAGREIAAKRGKPLVVPLELKKALAADKGAAAAFRQMRPGLRREYADYIADAKRDETRQRRLDKILPMIARGAGLNDKYRR